MHDATEGRVLASDAREFATKLESIAISGVIVVDAEKPDDHGSLHGGIARQPYQRERTLISGKRLGRAVSSGRDQNRPKQTLELQFMLISLRSRRQPLNQFEAFRQMAT